MDWKLREKIIWLADAVLSAVIILITLITRRRRYTAFAVFALIVIILAILTIAGIIDWGQITYTICKHVKCTGW